VDRVRALHTGEQAVSERGRPFSLPSETALGSRGYPLCIFPKLNDEVDSHEAVGGWVEDGETVPLCVTHFTSSLGTIAGKWEAFLPLYVPPTVKEISRPRQSPLPRGGGRVSHVHRAQARVASTLSATGPDAGNEGHSTLSPRRQGARKPFPKTTNHPPKEKRLKKQVVRAGKGSGRLPVRNNTIPLPVSREVFSIRQTSYGAPLLNNKGGSSYARLGLSRVPPKLKQERTEARMAANIDRGTGGRECTCRLEMDPTMMRHVVLGKCHERWRF